jgi:hypothetical protein
MLLELQKEEIEAMMKNPESLRKQVEEAVRLIRTAVKSEDKVSQPE